MPSRFQTGGRLHAVLLLLGTALLAVLCVQLWRTLQLEVQARTFELERAELMAERILRQAPQTAGVFTKIDPKYRFVVRNGKVVVDDTIGWLEPAASAVDDDVVVADRLERAARAEFTLRDAAAAEREFDELLAAALPQAQRLAVLAAALWQSHRAGASLRVTRLRTELDTGLGTLMPADLARPTLARALAAALRLPAQTPAPPWQRLIPFLPDHEFLGLGTPSEFADRQRLVAARRALFVAAQHELTARPPLVEAGLTAVAAASLLSWLPRADGGSEMALLTTTEWFAAVRAAGQVGELPVWPWLVEPDFVPDPAVSFAGVPGLRGVRPVAASGLGQWSWLLPGLTVALLVAFGLASWLQLRAGRREAAAVRAQAEFLTTVTHELKTPLASIRLLSEMLGEGRAMGREADYYRMLTGEAQRLSMLIENVLDLGRVERGERAYDLRQLDVGEVVRETVELLQPQGLGVTFLGAPRPVLARLDRSALTQALISVLDNARKYGQPPIEVAVTSNGGSAAQITVRDHGPGVPAAERERIFDRFVRGTAHAHGSTPGVGVGLYLARTIARRLQGDLVCSTPADGGPGALFTLTLPMETAA